MKNYQTLTFLCFLLFAGNIFAQTTETERPVLLTMRDSLWLTLEGEQFFIFHPVKAKQTLFSVGQYYSLGMEDLYENNPVFKEDPTLHIGQRIKIPVPKRAIKRYKTKEFSKWKHTPIYYVVKEGETLYNIGKRVFMVPIDTIVKRNKLKNNNIKPGQLLFVGWMHTEGVLPEMRPVKKVTPSDILKMRYDEEKKKYKEVETQGAAFWDKAGHHKDQLYILHRSAAIGTVAAVTNPMFNRTVYAKVIGRVPSGFDQGIEVILSRSAVQFLAAKDQRFFVKLKYLH
jgi:LysM repeat protein